MLHTSACTSVFPRLQRHGLSQLSTSQDPTKSGWLVKNCQRPLPAFYTRMFQKVACPSVKAGNASYFCMRICVLFLRLHDHHDARVVDDPSHQKQLGVSPALRHQTQGLVSLFFPGKSRLPCSNTGLTVTASSTSTCSSASSTIRMSVQGSSNHLPTRRALPSGWSQFPM